VTVISPTGYFAFTPLLASTSVGTLEYRVALESVRRLSGVQLVLGRARDINVEKNQITIASGVPNPAKSQWSTSAPPRALGSPFQDEAKGREGEGAAEEELFALEYDKLVVAVGAFSATFGTPGVRRFGS
jgi:NADH dehydrogenase FAD-containing subunit